MIKRLTKAADIRTQIGNATQLTLREVSSPRVTCRSCHGSKASRFGRHPILNSPPTLAGESQDNELGHWSQARSWVPPTKSRSTYGD